MSLPPLAIYVHFPWCVRKCPYCDFNSHQAGENLPERDYVSTLASDLESDLEYVGQRRAKSVFLGGGTPSLFSPAAIGDVLAMLDRQIGFEEDVEITLEANPGTAEQGRFRGYVAAGVNRLSIGVQSFSDPQLEQLGRIHNAREAMSAFESARSAGFANINIDLMHGLPGQSLKLALEDLAIAIELAPEHISWYQLTVEPNTRFYKHPPRLPNEDTLAETDRQGEPRLGGAGYDRYEVSAYTRAGHASLHNLNYWLFGDYIGLGAGAHGKLTTPAGIMRTTRTRSPADYLAAPGRKSKPIEPSQLRLEFLMNALRLRHGFSTRHFTERTGLPASTLDAFLGDASERGLISIEAGIIRPTETGFRFLNDLLLLIDS